MHATVAVGFTILCLLGTVEGRAQVGGDSLSRITDSLAPPGSQPTPDSTAADTAAPTPVTPAPTPTAPTAPTAPTTESADTTLKRVCRGAPPGVLAPGLLAVVFRPGTTKPQAIDAARAIGGTIAGMSDAGEVYVEVPPTAGPLKLVADQLIRQDPVTRVSPTPCPAPAPPAGAGTPPATTPDTGSAKPADSAGAPPVRSGP